MSERKAAVDLVGAKEKENEIIPFLVEVEFNGEEKDFFLKVRETLTRIGVPSRYERNVLFQTCHILHKRSKFYIVHFKTLFILDGRDNNLTRGDIARQNKIVKLLEEWGLIRVVDQSQIEEPVCTLANIRVVKYVERNDWQLKPKYSIGSYKGIS